jgi:hypothetical protein
MPPKLVMYEAMTWLVMEMLCTTLCPMNFIPLNKTWTATFLLTLMNTIELYSWCSVRVEKEGIQIIEKTMGSVWRMCQDIDKISN